MGRNSAEPPWGLDPCSRARGSCGRGRGQRSRCCSGVLVGVGDRCPSREWVSDAEVAETSYTAFTSTRHPVTARLVVRRIREKNPAPPGQEELFATWRHHAFLTDTELSTVDTDLTHRAHAVIEQTFADLIDGPPAHLPSGRFAANAA
jgi:hypothetical protein